MSDEAAKAGGAAAAGGFAFQDGVAACLAGFILAEASLPWLPSFTAIPESIRCETEAPVDDILVGTKQGGWIFVQAKKGLQINGVAGILDQCVRLFVHCRSALNSRGWERPLNRDKDQVVVAVDPNSAASVRIHLSNILQRFPIIGDAWDSAAQNKQERKILSRIRDGVHASWKGAIGSEPSDAEVVELLSLIRLVTLDPGSAEHQGVDGMLRTVILADPEQSAQSWTVLLETGRVFAKNRTGADRRGLQRVFLDHGIELKSLPNYHNDIASLKGETSRTLQVLKSHSHIESGGGVVKLNRKVTERLLELVPDNSLLVVGEPGAGKSGVLYDLAKRTSASDFDVVVFSAEDITSASLDEFQGELNLSHGIIDVLDNWFGAKCGFLIIDALDAARDPGVSRCLRQLIGLVADNPNRWRVVASIRKFDLRHSTELKRLFRQSEPISPDFTESEFAGTRHVNVARLSDQEIEEVKLQSPQLSSLLEAAPERFRELLRFPFNLQLAAELLDDGVNSDELRLIESQLQLLDRYWHERVTTKNGQPDGRGDARAAVLREACQQMVLTRSLKAQRSRLGSALQSEALSDVLSAELLVEEKQGMLLVFAHHVLFDYATFRLLLPVESGELSAYLARDPQQALLILPSLDFYFRDLWQASAAHDEHWRTEFRCIQTEGVPEIARLIGPSVAAELAASMTDLDRLRDALASPDQRDRETAERAFEHLVGALTVGSRNPCPLKGPVAGPWCEFAEGVSQQLSRRSAFAVASLLSVVNESKLSYTAVQSVRANAAGQRLLKLAWSELPYSPWLAIRGIQIICATFEADKDGSRTLLRQAVGSEHLRKLGYQELPWLAREVATLSVGDPTLVEEIYRSAFAESLPDESPTEMVPSRIIGLISNKRQDYEHGLWQLAELYPQFLKAAPLNATLALIAVLESYVSMYHTPSQVVEGVFEFYGTPAHVRLDLSAIWDAGSVHAHEDPIRMLNAFDRFLATLAVDVSQQTELANIVHTIVRENRLAILWRRVLMLAKQFPNPVGSLVKPLLWAPPILSGFDTTEASGDLLKEVFRTLSAVERERIERAILSIPDFVGEEGRSASEHYRNRLLGCLDRDALRTGEARNVLDALIASEAVPENTPMSKMEVVSGAYSVEDFLRDRGVPFQLEPNKTLLDAEKPVRSFVDAHRNSTPQATEIVQNLASFRKLRDAIERQSDAHQDLRDHAWGTLAEACSQVARQSGISFDGPVGQFLVDTLLSASCQREPVHHPERDVEFDRGPSWGGPAARIDAAVGLVTLARTKSFAAAKVVEAIDRLARDAVPAVRFQIARGLTFLCQTSPDFMWGTFERMCREEASRGVLQGLVSSLNSLAGAHPERVTILTKEVFDRVTVGPGADHVRESCLAIFTGLYVWQKQPLCYQVLTALSVNPIAFSRELCSVAPNLREAITNDNDEVRGRSLSLIGGILAEAKKVFEAIQEGHAGSEAHWSQSDLEDAHAAGRVIDQIVHQLYFASGALGMRQATARNEPGPTDEQRFRLYKDSAAMLDALSDIGLPSIAHALLETLESFVTFDPPRVFLRIAGVLRAAKPNNYQYEQLAAGLFVRLVEEYLADYGYIFKESEDCRKALLEVLDIFVAAGWPEARRLTFGLEEQFR